MMGFELTFKNRTNSSKYFSLIDLIMRIKHDTKALKKMISCSDS